MSGPSRLLPALFAGLAALTVAVLLLTDDSPNPDPLAAQSEADAQNPTTRRTAEADSGTAAAPTRSEARQAMAQPDERAESSNSLPPDTLLRGLVLDGRDGSRVANATVRLSVPTKADTWNLDPELFRQAPEIEATETDADGRFELAVEPGRLHWLRIAHEAYADRKLSACYGGSELVIELQPGAILHGQVTVSGEPAGGVQIRGFQSQLGELFRTETDSRGFYEQRGIHPGTHTVEITTDRAASPPWQRLEFAAGEALRHDVDLEPGNVTRGRITDAKTGLPIRGAFIGTGWTYRRTVTSDFDGRYELFGFPEEGVSELYVKHPGYVETFSWLADTPAEDGIVKADFALQAGLRATGRVLDSRGEPLAGARVTAIGEREIGPGMSGAHQVAARSGEDGRYDLADLEAGRPYELVVRHPGYGHFLRPFPKALAAGESLELDDAVLQRAARVRGSVRDEHGEPVAGARISLRLHAAGDRFAEQPGVGPVGRPYTDTLRTTTDNAGRFHFTDLPAGQHALSARRGRGPEAAAQIELAAEQALLDLELELFLGQRIAGRLLTADGEPVELATANVFRIAAAGQLIDPPEQAGRTAAQDGKFEIDGLRPGRYRFDWRCWRPPGPKFRVEAQAGDTGLVFRMPMSVAVTGQVVGPGGNPVPGCYVSAVHPESSNMASTTDREGRFRLEVPPGQKFDLEVRVPNQPGAGGLAGPVTEAELADPDAARELTGPIEDLVLQLQSR